MAMIMGLALVLLYMVLLVFGTTITPGVGRSGELIALLPQWLTESSHVPAYGLLTWFLARGLVWREWPLNHALFTAAAGAMVFGIWMEIVQGSVPGRVVSMDDVIANGVGIGIAVFLITWRVRSRHRSNMTISERLCIPVLEQGVAQR